MTDHIVEQGTHGLVYLTDATNAGIFIAAFNPESASALAALARSALLSGDQTVPMHMVHDHAHGARITVPEPEWMTPAQRRETVSRLRAHLTARLVS
jgi:hypothetical protein